MGRRRRRFRRLAAAEIGARDCAWRVIRGIRDQLATPDAAAAQIAARQHGVISAWQLVDAGIRKDAIARRVRAGRLHRIHRGIYALGHPGISRAGEMVAALLAVGSGGRLKSSESLEVLDLWGAAISHRSAAEQWGILPASLGPVHVSVPRTGGRSFRQGIRLHRRRSLTSGEVTLRRGIPTTTPERTLSDLHAAISRSSSMISATEFRRALRDADALGLRLGDASDVDGTRSELEWRFLQLCRRHHLPPPEVNVRIDLIEVDFLWPRARLVVEMDGYRYHRGRAAFERDRIRDLRLREFGYTVIRLTHRQLLEEPAVVVRILRDATELGHGRIE